MALAQPLPHAPPYRTVFPEEARRSAELNCPLACSPTLCARGPKAPTALTMPPLPPSPRNLAKRRGLRCPRPNAAPLPHARGEILGSARPRPASSNEGDGVPRRNAPTWSEPPPCRLLPRSAGQRDNMGSFSGNVMCLDVLLALPSFSRKGEAARWHVLDDLVKGLPRSPRGARRMRPHFIEKTFAGG